MISYAYVIPAALLVRLDLGLRPTYSKGELEVSRHETSSIRVASNVTAMRHDEMLQTRGYSSN
jgi:hypothetical protein